MLERLNRFLYASTQTSRYVTLFYGELDPARRRLAYVNAGHVPPYVRRRDGREERLTAGGPVLGLLDDVALEAGEVALEPGDLLAVVTDGVTEALSPGGDEFGDERVAPGPAPGRPGGARPGALSALVARGGRLDRARRLHRRPHRTHPESDMTQELRLFNTLSGARRDARPRRRRPR